MAYGQNDPATDRRISRLSLISSAANFYAGKSADPNVVLNAAIGWEEWVYQGQPAVTNGVSEAPAPEPAPTCAMCGNPLTPVQFKNGNVWPIPYLVTQGQTKYGQILCKTHYFGKKPAQV